MTAEISGADGFRTLVGTQTRFAAPLALLLAAAAFAGLALASRRGAGGSRLLRILLVVWFMLPAALLTVVATTAYIHYFIVLLPLPFFGVALLAERVAARSSVIAVVGLFVVLAYFGANDAWLFRKVERDGGAPADYGVAYRYKLDTIKTLDRLSAGKMLDLGGDAGPEYRFLRWNLDVDAQRRSNPVRRYVITDTLISHRAPRGRVVAREGPLVISVPSR